MKVPISLLAFIVVASANTTTHSKDITLASGEVLTDVTVISQDAAFVTFAHNSGIVRLAKMDLDQEILDFYGLAFDKNLALEQEERERRDNQLRVQTLKRQQLIKKITANMEIIHGVFLNKTPRGALFISISGSEAFHVESRTAFEKSVDGEYTELKVWKHGVFKYTTVGGKEARVPNYIADPDIVADLVESGEIQGPTK
jgi:hypothetical protein